MKKKNISIALLAIGLIACTGLASAYGQVLANDEQRSAIEQAIEDGDFDAWKAAMMETLTQENFDKLVERHNAMSERMELGLAVKQAIEDGDYQAYTTAIEALANHNVMSEEEFNTMVERYDSGEYGLGPMPGFGFQKNRGEHPMPCQQPI